METLIANAKKFNKHEKQLFVLLYQCPLGEPLNSCVISYIRRLLKSDDQKVINYIKKEEINKLISAHEKCMFNRVRGRDLKLITKNNPDFCNNAAYLKWTGKANISYTTIALKKRNWIYSQCEFAKLFDNTGINHKVRCNMKYKYEIAYFLFRFRQDNYFFPVNSKGYFCIAEQHIVDFSGKSLPKNTLKYISCKIRKKPGKYFVIIKETEEIIKEITHCSR